MCTWSDRASVSDFNLGGMQSARPFQKQLRLYNLSIQNAVDEHFTAHNDSENDDIDSHDVKIRFLHVVKKLV